MNFKGLIKWLPGIVSELVSVALCIIYAVTDGTRNTMYAQLIVASLLPFLFPVYGAIAKKPLPLVLSVISAVFVFFACGLGSAMGLYNEIYCWDLIMHGAFGFICSLFLFVFLLRWNGGKLNPAGFLIFIFVFTMGVAALWEVWEYLSDMVTGADSQKVAESIALGKSPLADTMEDIMIAMAGVAAFYLTFLIDKLTNHRIFGKLCGFNGFEKAEKISVVNEETV